MVSVAISLGAQVDFAGLKKSAMQELAKHKIPAASIAVVRGDRIVYSKVFGTASLETGDQELGRGSINRSVTESAMRADT